MIQAMQENTLLPNVIHFMVIYQIPKLPIEGDRNTFFQNSKFETFTLKNSFFVLLSETDSIFSLLKK